MRQRLDIADVEQRTKIRAKYLRALENEEWSLLPGPTFVRTFLRTYAEVVGVDPHLLVEEYRQSAPERDEQLEYPSLAPPTRDRGRGGGRPPSRGGAPRPRRGLAVGIAAVCVIGFLLALGLVGGDEEPDEAAERSTTTERPPPERQPETTERPPPERRTPSRVVVRVTPTAPTYVCVDNGPGTDIDFEDTIESPHTFRDPRLVRLNLGVRSAEVTRNGEPVEFPDSSEPLGLALRRGGATDISTQERPCG